MWINKPLAIVDGLKVSLLLLLLLLLVLRKFVLLLFDFKLLSEFPELNLFIVTGYCTCIVLFLLEGCKFEVYSEILIASFLF